MRKKLPLFINLVLVSLIFFFGNAMTTTPGYTSGNGNPAIILFLPLFVLFIALVVQWVNLLKDRSISLKTLLISLIFIIVHFVAGITYQVRSHHKYRDFLASVY